MARRTEPVRLSVSSEIGNDEDRGKGGIEVEGRELVLLLTTPALIDRAKGPSRTSQTPNSDAGGEVVECQNEESRRVFETRSERREFITQPFS